MCTADSKHRAGHPLRRRDCKYSRLMSLHGIWDVQHQGWYQACKNTARACSETTKPARWLQTQFALKCHWSCIRKDAKHSNVALREARSREPGSASRTKRSVAAARIQHIKAAVDGFRNPVRRHCLLDSVSHTTAINKPGDRSSTRQTSSIPAQCPFSISIYHSPTQRLPFVTSAWHACLDIEVLWVDRAILRKVEQDMRIAN